MQMKVVKEHGIEKTYYDDTGLNYEVIYYMDDNRKAVEPKDATNCIIKVFKNGKCVRRVYGKCGLEDDDGTSKD